MRLQNQKMYKIINNSNNFSDINHFESICSDFLPHAQQYLEFDKPVDIELVSDMENAKDPFGKTAYYDPNAMKITLFIDKRHVKDILRSLSHELVHHSQNCKGEFDKGMNTGPGYAQKDPHMRKCESEAYLHGNGLMWRDFEDEYKQKNLNLENINSKINYLLEHYEKETLVMQDKKVEESIFAPNHYCVHHGGVQMEGVVKLGKVINHNWNEDLQKVTKYDMEFEDGTILEGVEAEDILVTNASLAEGHGGHPAKRDDDTLKEEKQSEAWKFTWKRILSNGKENLKSITHACVDQRGEGGCTKTEAWKALKKTERWKRIQKWESRGWKRHKAEAVSKPPPVEVPDAPVPAAGEGSLYEATHGKKNKMLFEDLIKKWCK
jgi:hypothetical protein